MDFDKFYFNTCNDLKLSYLDAIIRNNKNLQAEFISFVEREKSPVEQFSYEAFIKTLTDTKNFYIEEFQSVDTENPDWDSYTPTHGGYIEEWEAYKQASEQEFQEVFEHFMPQALTAIIQQQPDELLAMITGLYEAAREAEVEDDVSSFDDVNDHLLSEFAEIIKTINEKLRLSPGPSKRSLNAIQLFFTCWSQDISEQITDIQLFEPLLMTLAEKINAPDQLLMMMQNTSIQEEFLPELTLFLHKKSGNENNWLQCALRLYQLNKQVAHDLLMYYHENDQTAFVRFAHKLLLTDEHHWAKFLKGYITPQMDKELYNKVYISLICYDRKIEHYIKVKPYLDDVSYSSLLKQVSYDKPFMAQLFETDGRYADIKTLVEKDANRWDFDQMIAPIIKVYPEYSLEKIKAMAAKTLETERGRHVYEDVSKWLLLAKQIPGFENEAAELIKNTYNHKPNLPALRDEMRKAGVVG